MNESTESVDSLSETVNEGNTDPSASRPKKALPRRSFDLLKEHRSYCPYVVRSTMVPSLPIPPMFAASVKPNPGSSNGHSSSLSVSQFNDKTNTSGALEGWKAVLFVVLRYGMAHRQRIEYNFLARKDPQSDGAGKGLDTMEVDSVRAMVTGVKARGVCLPPIWLLVFSSLIIQSIGQGSAEICPRPARLNF